MSDDQIRRIEDAIKGIVDAQNETREELVILQTKFDLMVKCPRPGLCVALEAQVNAQDKLIEQGKGAWKLASLISAALAALGTYVSVKLGWK